MKQKSQLHIKIETKSKLRGKNGQKKISKLKFHMQSALENGNKILFSIPTQQHKSVTPTTPKREYKQTKLAHSHE